MAGKAVKVALGILLLPVVLIMGLAGGGYLYLKPEKNPASGFPQDGLR